VFRWMSNKLVDLYNKLTPEQPKVPVSTASTQLEAKFAVQKADRALANAVTNRETVDSVVHRMRHENEKNHFAQLIARAMGGVE
jgi:TATA-box binding protein (TBP) (component of TFIID and TFIIIB)